MALPLDRCGSGPPPTARPPPCPLHALARSSPRTLPPLSHHHLTLHEYRRQQAAPSPPPAAHGKRVRKKPAASQLTAGHRVLASSSRLSPRQTTRSEEPLKQHGSSLTRPVTPSFRSLPTSLPSPPLTARPSFDTDTDAPPAEDALLIAEPTPRARAASKAKIFKPTKRLPRPPDVETRQWAYTALRTEDKSSRHSSSTGITITSTLSLSKFPFPQPPQSAPILARQDQAPSRIQQNPYTSPSENTPPPTPAVLHYRGISFDVVNPHQSLYFSNFETPAEKDTELDNYFRHTSLHDLSHGSTMAPRNPSEDEIRSRQRIVFEDLPSAHASIAKTKAAYRKPPAPAADLPLPPTPAVLSSKPSVIVPINPFENEVPVPAPLDVRKAPRPPSFMQRLSGLFNRDRRSTTATELTAKDAVDLDPTQNPLAISQPSRVGLGNSSAPVVGYDEERDIETGRGPQRASVSEAALSNGGYYDYDVESFYGDSDAGGLDSRSLYMDDGRDRNSVPFDIREQKTDYSNEADISSYAFEFSPPRESSHVSRRMVQSRSQEPFFASRNTLTQSSRRGSTIGSIINGYGYSHSGDLADASFQRGEEDLMNVDDDGLPVPDLYDQTGGGQDPTRRIAGYSQFDFGDTRGASTGSSPMTSASGTFRAASGNARVQARVPPNTPLPEAPSAGNRRAYPSNARLNSGVSSEYLSRVSSYGDTRKLLLISGDVQSPSYGRLSVKDHDLVPADDANAPPIPDRHPNRSMRRLGSSTQTSLQTVLRHTDDEDANEEDFPRRARIAKGLPGSSQRDMHYLNQRAGPTSPVHSPPAIIRQIIAQKSPSGLSERTIRGNRSREYTPTGLQIPSMWRKSSPSPQKPSANRPEPSNRESFSTLASVGSAEDESSFGAGSSLDDDRDWETVGDGRPSKEVDRGDEFTNEIMTGHAHGEPLQPNVSPPYDFRGGAGYPHLNALTPRRNDRAPYERPSPLEDDHAHPFNSSPPQISPKSQNFPVGQENDLPVERDMDDESQYSTHSEVDEYLDDGIPLVDLQFTAEQTQALLNSGPNESILINHAHSPVPSNGYIRQVSGQSMRKRHSNGAVPFAPLPLRVGDHIIPKSPVERDNSYNKLTVLGPDGNITGTPNGTGIRDAGSSVANSSTPRPGLSYDPEYGASRAWVSSPLDRLSHFSRCTTHSVPGSVGSIGPADSQTNILRSHRNSSAATKISMREAFQAGASIPRSPLAPRKRASVPSQTHLKQMHLSPQDDDTVKRKPSRHGQFNVTSRQLSTANSSLDEDFLARCYGRPGHRTFSCIPHLERRARPQSSVYLMTRSRKKKLSWAIFALVCWFPPLLLLYGMGWLDWLMLWWSGRQIEHCGNAQKKLALVLGIIGSMVAPFIAIGLIVTMHFGALP